MPPRCGSAKRWERRVLPSLSSSSLFLGGGGYSQYLLERRSWLLRAHHKCLLWEFGDPFPCRKDPLKALPSSLVGHLQLLIFNFPFPSCKTEEKFRKDHCKRPCPGHTAGRGHIPARRGAVGAPAPKSSPRVGTGASRAPLGGGTGRVAGGARRGSGGTRLTPPGAGSVGGTEPGAERVPCRLEVGGGDGMGATGEQGASTQVSRTGGGEEGEDTQRGSSPNPGGCGVCEVPFGASKAPGGKGSNSPKLDPVPSTPFSLFLIRL